MKHSGTLPKGFTCTCGAVHDFPPYVYGHWDVELGMTCKFCDRRFVVLRGKVNQIIDAKGLVKHAKSISESQKPADATV
jgi:hypothetical protein